MPVLCVGPSVQKFTSHVQLMRALARQCTQYGLVKRNLADFGEMCSGVVILGLVLALVLAQEKQDNLIHVRLADQISLYYHQICHPRF